MYLYLKSSSQRHSPSSLTYHKRVLSHFFTIPPQKFWMRSHPTVDQLFTKLENLKVQEAEILHQIKIAHKLELEDLDLQVSGIALTNRSGCGIEGGSLPLCGEGHETSIK